MSGLLGAIEKLDVKKTAPERRAKRRTKMVLPVKVSLVSGTALAHTIDITYSGARLGGMRERLQPGEVIALTRGSQKAEFRIVWARQLGKHEFHAGLEAVQSQEQFWGVDLASEQRPAKKGADALMTLLKAGSKRTKE
ncbi:MAG TPA: PilZ domain-containing protein [Terriglobales bacterium]|nr:PilZ domain-containing protein [Terriglobales bacterium]